MEQNYKWALPPRMAILGMSFFCRCAGEYRHKTYSDASAKLVMHVHVETAISSQQYSLISDLTKPVP